MWRGPFRAANRSSKGEASRSLTSLPRLDPVRARELVSRFSGQPILVAGDVMLDRFIVGRVTRISPEAPVPIVRFESEYVRLGGAANVAHNIAALGGTVDRKSTRLNSRHGSMSYGVFCLKKNGTSG